ncbi:MAG: ribonuclease HII [Helicobacteraceae bacterium]|jgi:ribonuclease HII|nr:ribonuclease HII [Helicobacteraceae bacterium]
MVLCGIDEAGRGCLAGPMAIAGAVLERSIKGLDDSKKLTREKRAELFETIQKNAVFHIVLFSAGEIDEKGLSACLKAGLIEIKAAIKADRYLFDGNCSYGVSGVETRVKADASVAQVAAASILAKVSKDRALLQLAENYQQYGFDRHQGYGVQAHLKAIAAFGLTPFHRRSFKGCDLKTIDLFAKNSLNY